MCRHGIAYVLRGAHVALNATVREGKRLLQTLITLSTAMDAFLFVNTLTSAIVSSDEAP